jgi:hypothetical protein
MALFLLILAALVGGATLLIATGRWRYGFAPFSINADKMTVKRLGLLTPEDDVERVESILRSFAGGFNATITSPSPTAWVQYCDSLPALHRPFAHEGAAMGYTLRHCFRFRPAEFEERMVRPRSGFRYLYYVGLGFWWGMRNVSPRRVQELVRGLDPLHRYLCFDGYGFKTAFFDEPRDGSALERLNAFEGYARNAAYQGVGRANWFRFVGQPSALIQRLEGLGGHAADGAAGSGLAAAFVHPDRLESARRLAIEFPKSLQPHFHLGMCFGLKARSINDPQQFERFLSHEGRHVRDSVRASIKACDATEERIRRQSQPDGYRHWRASVTEWMSSNIEYPLAGVRRSAEADIAPSTSESTLAFV